MATEVSSTRLYLGNLPRNATKADVENHFAAHGTGEITEIKLMNGFGFIEYKDAMDARDVVPGNAIDGSDFMGERLVVQFARGSRRNEPFAHQERTAPRPRRTAFRMQITGLPVETSWQDLKDFARQSGLDVVYSEVSRDRDGKGFVEYETGADLTNAVEKLDNREFKGQTVRCIADIQPERPRDRFRSRSPPPGRRGGYGAPPDDYHHDRRGPPRAGYSPRRDDYRRRSPPPRDYYDPRDRYDRRGPPPVDDGYGRPPPRYREDAYDARAPPPPRAAYEPDPYMNGHSRPYDRPPSPGGRRPRSPPRGGYEDGYGRRPYW
ncbi:hypothetical protein W97_04527 [Coniosporium apollinis CBS 100218]|uniref:RRM domain-containing protein n=1 Tax=Coniosporium apollinis (strain CBS 100218) TaxID=1168221 RepID=R7YTZ6_CONA1|nr:uncharacterized protein W97_04527 [Coniosporium apollinis CBS 100218]EON65289.1 hypothetical protein W97_04527 [Coniosporium apollinis CBS 100218]